MRITYKNVATDTHDRHDMDTRYYYSHITFNVLYFRLCKVHGLFTSPSNLR